MIQINQMKLKIHHRPEMLKQKAAEILGIKVQDILSLEILRQSIDARKKPNLFYSYCIAVEVAHEEQIVAGAGKKGRKEQISLFTKTGYPYPKKQDFEPKERIVIVGAGPGGLFCAYFLALAGLKPLLIERGRMIADRKRDVEEFWETGHLRPDSNVSFGEGGAGTFSDGKLNTLIKDKDGRNHAVLETFVKFGAKESIVYEAKPHLGTDVLCKVIENMRREIVSLGGEVRFETQMTDILLDEENGVRKVVGIEVNHGEKLECNVLVLAIGHSARDTFEMLYHRDIVMEPKAFAVGFRVEHPQKMINESQYGIGDSDIPGAAPYKVSAQTSVDRGVYSFCMCPGGYVVNASSENGRLAVNGMSYSGRKGRHANSAVIVAVTPKDFPSGHPLSGIAFQRDLEKKAYDLANGKIPIQFYGDFKNSFERTGEFQRVVSEELPSCKGKYEWCDLTGILPEQCNQAFVEGMESFGHQIRGFNRPDAILSGVESRTSSPVRINRKDTLESVSVLGLYPCGEGAGYAGGITSAAMDGIRIAESIILLLKTSNED